MILTVTLNPSIDRRYFLNDFEKNGVYRAKEVQYTAGGKGLNVSRVIRDLKKDVIATGFLGGKSGEFIAEKLHKLDIQNEFIEIAEDTRSCLAILPTDGSQTEVLEPGPRIFPNELDDFYKKYKNIIDKCNIICASGSLPKGVPTKMYSKLIKIARDKGKKFILDTSGKALEEGIKASPYMIKPNKEELTDIIESSVDTRKGLIKAINILREYDIKIIVISLGKEGSVVYYKNKVYKINVPDINAVNPVGSGDSMIAGFAVALSENYEFENMLKLASACGTANAMESKTGKVDIKNVKDIMTHISIEKLQL